MSDVETTAVDSQKSDDKNLALLVHLGGIFFGFLPSLIAYLIKKDSGNDWLIDHFKEALNFQITVLLAFVVCMVLTVILIGALLMPLVWLAALVFCILAALKASAGEAYRYPVSLRLVK